MLEISEKTNLLEQTAAVCCIECAFLPAVRRL